MFDIFSKITEAKKRIEEVKKKLDGTTLSVSDNNNQINVTVSGAKDIRKITLSSSFATLPQEQMERLIADTCNEALNKAELLAKEEMKKATDGLLPNIPGLNLFG
jgi:DNA-binding protein YbaB